MRRSNLVSAGLIGITGLAFACGGATLQSISPDTVKKTVDVQVTSACTNTVSVLVDPASVTIQPGDTVTWTPLGGTREIVIRPKKGGRFFPPRKARWPFNDYPHVGRGGQARSGMARGNAKEGTYEYKVEVTCVSGIDTTVVDIDPDIIIKF